MIIMSENIGSNNSQRHADNKCDESIPAVSSVKIAEHNKYDNETSNKKKGDAEPEKKHPQWLKRPITEWILAGATIGICVLAILQWQALRNTDQTSRLRDRAFVYFADPIIEPFPNKENPVSYRNDIVIINAGNMPARRISVRHSWISFPVTENVIDPWPFVKKWSDAETANVLGPKQAGSFQGQGIPVETINDAKMSKIDIFVVMEAKYLDGFETEKVRITQMSRKLRFDKYSYSLGFAGPHNCTDDDCK
jgi:hypothetical protein